MQVVTFYARSLMNREFVQKILSLFYCISVFISMWTGVEEVESHWDTVYQAMLLFGVIFLIFWPNIIFPLLLCAGVGVSLGLVELYTVQPWGIVYKAFLIFALTFYRRHYINSSP